MIPTDTIATAAACHHAQQDRTNQHERQVRREFAPGHNPFDRGSNKGRKRNGDQCAQERKSACE